MAPLLLGDVFRPATKDTISINEVITGLPRVLDTRVTKKNESTFSKIGQIGSYILNKSVPYVPSILAPVMAYCYPIPAMTAGATYVFSRLLATTLLSKISDEDITKSNFGKTMKKMKENPISIPLKAFSEELIFRTGIQNILSYVLKNNISILVSSLLFGKVHMLDAKDEVSKTVQTVQAINATILGMTYGIIYNKYGLLGSFTTHMIHNLLSLYSFS